MDTNSGDPRGYVQEEDQADEALCEEEEYYTSDSDDDDVGRYVFLARQPGPAEASDDDDAMPVEGGGGGGGRKTHLRDREISGAPPPPPPAQKKARLGLTGPHGAGPEEAVRFRGEGRGGDQAKTTNRKRGQREPLAAQGRAARGKIKKSRIGSSGEDGRQAAPVLMQKKSFLCNVCGRCFGSHQALGGHVHFGHRKKTAETINAAGHDDVAGGNGYRDEKVSIAMVEAADGAARGEEKAAVAASSGESDPDSDGNGKKSVGVAACHQGVGNSSGRLGRNDDGSSNGMGMNNGAANNYHGDHGDGGESNVGQEKATVAVVTSRNGGNGTERKVAAAVGRCHEPTNGKANSGAVRKTRHRCEVCGKECLSGQALGGHMRKHRKRSPEADGTPVLV